MPTILLIEDDEALRQMLMESLVRAGFVVHAIPDGGHAAGVLQQHKVDAVVTDIMMPNRDGIETIMGLRTTHPNLPVVAMSGASSPLPGFYLSIAARLGAKRTIQKPFAPEKLITAVREVLGE